MIFDAVILAGGRGSRLGGQSKAALTQNGVSLLELALGSSAGAREVVVVGDITAGPGYLVTQESPRFSGPVAAIAAGVAQLTSPASDFTLVLACDIPGAAAAVHVVRTRVEQGDVDDGAIAVDGEGERQYLLAMYASGELVTRLESMTTEGASMRELVSEFDLMDVAAPSGSTDDVDTWHDADLLGVTR